MDASGTMRARREAVVRAHMEAEGRQDVHGAVGAFGRARYEIVPTGEVLDGEEAVTKFLAATVRGFPDMRFEIHELHHGDSAVLAEVTFHGTHRGFWRGIPPTGRSLSYRMCNVFVFEQDALVCERLYFDVQSVLRGLGLARDPESLTGRAALALNHPVHLARAGLRAVLGRR